MSVSTTRPAHTSSVLIPVLTPLHGVQPESFCVNADGTYWCGSAATCQFCLVFSGAEPTHCSFIREAGMLSVKRIDGRVWVNDLPVSGVKQLTEGDVISLGPVSYRLEFQDASSCLPEPDDRPLSSFKSAAIEAKREELDRREAETVAAEERSADTRRSAESIVQAAESERTALLRANMDLLCERNALSRLNQDLVSHESRITEREVVDARQLEDMRSRFTEFDQFAAELLAVRQQLEDMQQAYLSIEQRCQSLQLNESKLRQVSEELELIRAELAESIGIREELNAKLDMQMRTEPPQHLTSLLPAQQFGSSFAGALDSDRDSPHHTDLAGDSDCCDSIDPSSELTTDLRSELAELFGLSKPAAESVTTPQPAAAFVDRFEPSSENQPVVPFGSDSVQPAATESAEVVVGDAEPAREESQETSNDPVRDEDLVRDYMEQLLSRNRKSGGAALPGEPKAADRKKDPGAASAAKAAGGQSPKSPPKVKSYIEQYMAGNMGNMPDSEPMAMSGLNIEAREVAVFDEERPVQVRPKMDLVKLKESMESFRILSARSVESALASHAMDVQRLEFSRRTVFAALLILSTLVVGIANVYGAIDAPMLIWVTLISAIAVFSELYRQYLAFAVHTRSPLKLLLTSARSKRHIQRSTRLAASTSVVPDSASDHKMSVNDESVVPFRTFGRSESLPAETQVS